jgi:hypothetical protein
MREEIKTPAGAVVSFELITRSDTGLVYASGETVMLGKTEPVKITFKALGTNESVLGIVYSLGQVADGTYVPLKDRPQSSKKHGYFDLWKHRAANSPEGELPEVPSSWKGF